MALTDAEYREMLKDPGFAAADKALNQAWAEAKKVMPKAAFEALKKEQGAWVAKGRDTEVKEFMKNGMEAPKAYALVTEMRMRAIQTAAEDARSSSSRAAGVVWGLFWTEPTCAKR